MKIKVLIALVVNSIIQGCISKRIITTSESVDISCRAERSCTTQNDFQIEVFLSNHSNKGFIIQGKGSFYISSIQDSAGNNLIPSPFFTHGRVLSDSIIYHLPANGDLQFVINEKNIFYFRLLPQHTYKCTINYRPRKSNRKLHKAGYIDFKENISASFSFKTCDSIKNIFNNTL